MLEGERCNFEEEKKVDNKKQHGLKATRREVLGGISALGLSTALFGTTAVTSAMAQSFDPKKYAGTKISLLMVGGEGDDRALSDLLPEFEAETGMTIEITAPAIGPLIQKTMQNLQADQSSFEIINYLGFLTTQQVGGGYFTQLNEFVDNPEETPPNWDFGDFIPAAVKNVGIYDMESGTVGKGTDLYGIPGVHSGSAIYFYRKDLFDAAGLQPAKTWEEFQAAAEVLNTDEVAGASFIGANDISLALVDWYTRFITIGGTLVTGNPADKDFQPHVNSAEGIQALQMLIDLLPYAPDNVTSYGFAENVDGFAAGKIAQMIFWSTIAGGVFDKEESLVADKAATAPVPAAIGHKSQSVQGGWGLGIPKNVDPAKIGAAWRALTWITSKRVNFYVVEDYQIDANRTSAFTDPDLVSKFPHLTDSFKAIDTARIIPTSRVNEFFQLKDILTIEFNAALIGTQDAKTACDKVQSQWEAVLREAGHLA